MRNAIFFALAGIAAGTLIAVGALIMFLVGRDGGFLPQAPEAVVAPAVETAQEAAPVAEVGQPAAPVVGVAEPAPPSEEDVVRWRMASTFPGSLPQIGSLGIRVQDQIASISGGNVQIRFFDPGTLVPALEVFDAVSSGSIDAGWSTPGYWAGKVPALPLFAAVPFGPPANEYMAWFYFGGGRQLFEEIYARHNIRGLLCGVIPPEASGWFRRPVESVEDLQGLRMRFFGLGAKVMDRIGVSTQLLAAGDIFPALEMGTIHATEFSMPAIDLNLGFHQVAKHYYFPGWHQQSTNLELIINMESWNSLSPLQQMQVEVVCGDSFRHSIAEGETIQIAAIDELELRGVTIHRWPESMLATFRTAWEQVVAEEVAADADFARVWQSLNSFRERYQRWRELGYL